MKDKKLLEEICDTCKTDYCLLKELMLQNQLSDRNVLQIKMIEKFKYVWSSEENKCYSWNEAGTRFAKEYGKLYSDFWDKGEYTHHVTAMFHALKRGD